MTEAKSIAIHYPCASDCDNVPNKPDANHGDSTVKAIAEEGFIDFQA
jgi:hypothetical protein